MQQLPSVGRMVHYFSYGTPQGEYPASVARAAIITSVEEDGNPRSAVGLCVLNPTGMFFNQRVPHATYPRRPGGWDWPEYVAPVLDEQAYKDQQAAGEEAGRGSPC